MNQTITLKLSTISLAVLATLPIQMAHAQDANNTTSVRTCVDIISGPASEDSCGYGTINNVTATSLNTSGSTATAVGNGTGTTTVTGSSTTVSSGVAGSTTINSGSGGTVLFSTGSTSVTGTGATITSGTGGNTFSSTGNTVINSTVSAQAAPAVTISGQNGTTAPNTATGAYPLIPEGTGVLITGSGNTGGPDVYIASQNGEAAISVTNTGVTIISPSGTGSAPGQTINVSSTNNYGQQGAYNTGSVTNNFGNGNVNSTGAVTNTIGTSVAGGGSVTNTVGGGTGNSTNSFGNSTATNASSTNTLGNAVAGSYSTNNIGGGAGVTTNSMGNTNTASTIVLQAANASTNLANGVNTSTTTGSLESGVGGSTLSVTRTGITPDAYVSSTSGTVLNGATGTYATVDSNGKMSVISGTATQSSINMTLTNGFGNTHGLVVNESQATLSGGTRSTSLTLNDQGARFSNAANGAPVQVHGIAAGTAPNDAVNVQQLGQGVASAAALAGLPVVDVNKNFSIGVAGGTYMGYQASAIGVSARLTKDMVVKAGATTSSNNSVANIGLGYSW